MSDELDSEMLLVDYKNLLIDTKLLRAKVLTLEAKLATRNKNDLYANSSYERLQKKLRNFPVIPMMRAGCEEKRLEVWHQFARNVYRWRDDFRGNWKE